MPFEKGKGKTGGRKPGVPNKTRNQLKELVQSHTEAAVQTLVSIMGDGLAAQSARVAAANSLLDRGYGKPAQQQLITGNEDGGELLVRVITGVPRGAPARES